jgi:hypothetical protein
MAEPTSAPALPSTADATPYVPVSWMAVGAFAVAAVFLAIILIFGVIAFSNKKPLIQDELLALPAIGIVLSFAARRVIRNSEGTRTGERLANQAWWICVVAGLGYAAYLAGVAYSVRRDARQVLERWVGNLQAEDERSFYAAFLLTREPAQRANMSPDNVKEIQGRFRDDLISFEQNDLVRLIRRNKGEGDSRFTIGGIREWNYRGGGVDCTFSAVLKCPEGSFPVVIGLRGLEAVSGMEGAGRQWGIFYSPTGFVVREQQSLTPYGWQMLAMEESGSAFAGQLLMSFRAGPWVIPYIYHLLIKPDPIPSKRYWQEILPTTPGRIAVCGTLAAARPYTSDYFAYSFADEFFKAPSNLAASSDKRAQFKTIWDSAGLLPAGGRLRNSPDTHASVVITDTAVEVRVPCELPSVSEGNAAARGKIVVVSDDPGLLAEIKRLKAEANPDAGTSSPPQELLKRDFRWRIARIESDMKPVIVQQQRPGEPGVPGGGGPVPASGP